MLIIKRYKINVTKNAVFFLSRAPTHNGFTFNSRFLYEMKHKVSTKSMDPLTLKRRNSFQN